MIAEGELLRERLEMLAIDETRAQDGETAFGHFGEATIELGGDGQLQDGVAEEFEALVVRDAITFFVAKGGMRESEAQQGLIGKGMAEALLQIIKAGTHFSRC